MELYKRIVELVDSNLIYCLIPMILALMLAELIFKKRFETKKVLYLIRWTIIVYTIITLTTSSFYSQESSFNYRSTSFIYWILFLCSGIIPFSLFIKQLSLKFWYVLIIAFCMKIGVYFERFVMITASFHRDYLAENEFLNSIFFGLGVYFLQGIIMAVFALGFFELYKKRG